MNNIIAQEILTYEIYELEDNIYELSIPVQNLITPNFMIINDDLIILLQSYTKSYIVKKIPQYIIEAIKKRNCYLVENLNSSIKNKHLISLA